MGLERFVMTMCSYGYFGDLMKHSENLRCLGRYRYDLSGVRTFLRHKSYSGTINYVPSGVPDQQLLTDSCGEGCPQCSYKGKIALWELKFRALNQWWWSKGLPFQLQSLKVLKMTLQTVMTLIMNAATLILLVNNQKQNKSMESMYYVMQN